MKKGIVFEVSKEDKIAFVIINIVGKKFRIAGCFGLPFDSLIFVEKAKMQTKTEDND